jgi:hypothetical protein
MTMEMITIGNLVVKLVKDNKTIARTHALNNGNWAVRWGSYYGEFSEVVAKELFALQVASAIITEV